MTRVFKLVVAFAALAFLASATITASSSSLTTASFAAPPGKVFDASATTNADYTNWEACEKAYFGPGTDNTTIWVYGLGYTSATTIDKVVSRKLNASLLSNGTADTTMASVIGTDAAAAPATAITGNPVYAVGLGSIAFAYVATDTASPACSQVYLAIYSGGTSGALVTKAVTSNACVTCASTASGVVFANMVGSVFYENSTYFVSYTSTKTTTAWDTTNSVCSTTSITYVVTSYLQGVAVSSTGTLTWTTVPTIYTATTSTPTASTLAVKCGRSNYTNSTTHYCTYKDGTGSTANTKYVPITVASGAAGTVVTIATDSTTTAGAYPLTTMVYTPVGYVYSQYQQGVLINNLTTYTATSGGTPTYTNYLQLYNLTSGATATVGGAQISGYTNTYASGAIGGAGISYSMGFAILDAYMSSSTAMVYEYGGFFANGSTNGTKTTVASTDASGGAGNWFVDANGALWFGAYSVDTGNSYGLVTGNVGKLISQLYYSAGNILASFFALLSVMIAALLAF